VPYEHLDTVKSHPGVHFEVLIVPQGISPGDTMFSGYPKNVFFKLDRDYKIWYYTIIQGFWRRGQNPVGCVED
jgi:hypothetical protein